ncbi:NAD(P)H pyrophosphatase NUDT13, mitochondrial isoform X3 [Meriones unguiculatus]|uniref:NAD(P)H pyrophosphatase NUDT13, mitochondrial isoform X3 n=1 Tax=Meriones unguiculatus TaxID=10047 RepID=UPI00293E0E62|nr:NAD(P)H pyrophosphatase NUDT13, mitochondrial isoform X3 [Meriones unguiculatus]
MSLYCGTFFRRKSFWCYRLLSTYVTKTRYLFELKEDDEACRRAQQTGAFYLFHDLDPLLQASGHRYLAPRLSRAASLPKSEMEAELRGSFIKLRQAVFQLDSMDSSLLFTAQALLRWHDGHQFCSKSGQPTKKNMAGSKRVCPSNNIIYYPQMAPVVITLVSDGARCLLARQSSFPKGLYSALAGFCDIGENVEEAVQREVAEEVGLEVENIQYFSSQHWPFPNSSLMIACHATVKPGQTEIRVNVRELEAAAWFGLDEVAAALRRKGSFTQQQSEASPLLLPPKLAIAHHMIKKWVEKQSCSSMAA